MSVTVRQRTDTKEPAWQVDIKAMPAGSLKAKRYRYTAPRSITSKSGALRWGEQMRREIEAGKPPPQSREARAVAASTTAAVAAEFVKQTLANLTIKEAAAVYLADSAGRGNATGTLGSKRQRLNNIVAVIGDTALSTCGEAEGSRVRSALRDKGLIASTINAHLRLLQSVLHRCCRLGHRTTPPPRIEGVKDRRVKTAKAYDDGTFELLVMQATTLGAKYLALVLTLGEAGLRVGELRGLEVRDLDSRGFLNVGRSVDDAGEVGPPKNGEVRVVHLTPRVLAALTSMALGRDLGSPLFAGRDGGRLTRMVARVWLEKVQRLAGLPLKGPHVLRHTCASSALAGGADAVAVQHMLGHRNLKTTLDAYLHDTGDAPARAMAALVAVRSKVEAGVTDQSRTPGHGRKPRVRSRKPK